MLGKNSKMVFGKNDEHKNINSRYCGNNRNNSGHCGLNKERQQPYFVAVPPLEQRLWHDQS